MSDGTGDFLWYDLLTTDPEGARAFYPKVTGWGLQPWEGGPEGAPPYMMWTAGETPIGGVGLLPDEAGERGGGPHWLAYVRVADVDAAVEAAEAEGGRLVGEPMDVPDVGRMATIADPHGAVIALFRPESEAPPSPTPGPGLVTWHELSSGDRGEAIPFYRKLFGWEPSSSFDMGGGNLYEMFSANGKENTAIFDKPEEMPAPMWLYYVSVADLDAAVGAVNSNGGTVLNGPMEVPGGDRIAQCLDPQGAMFALHEKVGG